MLVFFVTLIILFLIICLSFYFSNLVIHPKIRGYEETFNIELKSGKIIKETYDNLNSKEIFIDSDFGYKIHGLFISCENPKGTIIFCHGRQFSLYGSVKYIDIFLKRNFNVFMYDHRSHGKSGGPDSTFGYYEKDDLKKCTDWVIKTCGENSIIGVHGESLGAATALLNSAIDDRISFYIADCPFSDMSTLLKIRLKEDYKLPSFPLIPISSFICYLRSGFFYKYVSPLNSIKNVHTPMFFIHGINDTYIPNEMSVDMYNVKPGFKKLYIAPNADHAEALWNNKKEYEEKINEFLEEINIL